MDIDGCTWRCMEAVVISEEGGYGGISSGFNFDADDVLDEDSSEKGGLQGLERDTICR
jgi:hypothetical protein